MNTDQDFASEKEEGLEEVVSAVQAESSEMVQMDASEAPRESALEAFTAQLGSEPSAENKIRLSIEFMRTALSASGTPRFRDFWQARRLCLPLFKENLNGKVRVTLWEAYVELSAEARRLKEILDEQSAFAVEQIELAISALERDLEQYPQLLEGLDALQLPRDCISLQKKRKMYEMLQRELHLLSTLASRVNGLRKEVLKTEMRIRTKNKLFERLSACGDQTFPKRKELIKQISSEFLTDVEQFIQEHFQQENPSGPPLYALREEIKVLQSVAKTLTLNTHTFTQTRLKLSACWDSLKEKEKERKKELSLQKVAFKQNFDACLEKITAFAELCKGEISSDEATRQYNEISAHMKTVELGREELRDLKDALQKARRVVSDRERLKEEEKLRREKESELALRAKINLLKQDLQELFQKAEKEEAETILHARDALWETFGTLSTSKTEKQIIERLFKQIKDRVNEKKEKTLMALSEADLQSLEKLKALLEELKERRSEVKTQLEGYRKAIGGSGFDFEKAMHYRELIESEKLSLDKINASIYEIEDKIRPIEC
jgi:hypothetical protein